LGVKSFFMLFKCLIRKGSEICKRLNEKIDETVLDIMSDVKVEFSLENLVLDMTIFQRKRYKDRLIEKTINSMKESGFGEFTRKNEYVDGVTRFTFDLSKPIPVEKFPYLDHVSLHKIECFDEETGEKMLITANPGDFKGVMYVSEQSSDALTEGLSVLQRNEKGIKTQKELKAIWKAATGVYLFRNDFRIFPYGQSTFDWLGFTERSQKEKSNIFKMHTVSGYVDLDSMSSENLMEQTNRQGLIEDEYGNNFLTIMRDIITLLAFRLDVNLREELNVNGKNLKDNKIHEVFTNDKNVVFYRTIEVDDENSTMSQINKAVEVIASSPAVDSETQKAVLSLKEGINKLIQIDTENKQRFKQEATTFEKQIIDLQSLIGLAGQGMIVEALTHELHRIEDNIKEYAKETRDIVNLNKDQYGESAKFLIENQDRILQEIIFLQQQLEHLEPTYTKNKLRLEELNIKELLQGLYLGAGPMAKKAQKDNIEVIIEGEEFVVTANKGMLITIFDNLFINSLYWVKDSDEKRIYFKLSADQKQIFVWDTGPGFHPDIINVMFEPYKSMKNDGRGLGLYIVSELVRMLHGSISVVENHKNKLDNLYQFQISLN
ncbi:sensor histidine kinase, partial [Brevibacillus agri]|uniref:sensor histidine kinase n=1 Tax=Brevibacillus agri TaxID=51101 RepID=UPI0028682D4B